MTQIKDRKILEYFLNPYGKQKGSFSYFHLSPNSLLLSSVAVFGNNAIISQVLLHLPPLSLKALHLGTYLENF